MREVYEIEEDLLRVPEVEDSVVGALRSHGLDVEADDFALLPVTVANQDVHLVEGAAQVDGPEGFVLVVFQAVLIVEVNAPELAVEDGVGHFVAGVEAGQDAVGGFDQDADAIRVLTLVS